jgi:site-specific DNA-cytosine methylase
MNVLSLFDGMSCGRIALDRLGIKVDNYYASEIDKYAMKVSEANYPDIIQIGDVTKINYDELPQIDLIMGGSPCQGFSFAGKQLAFDDPRSALFFCFWRAVKHLKPKYFLLENVRMKKEYLDVISEYMGVEPIMINSALVSAQNRVRYYWTNIPGIEQPEQRGIVLRDILETKEVEGLSDKAIDYMNRSSSKWSGGKTRKDIYIKHESEKGMCLTANMHKGVPYGVIETKETKWRKLTPVECERLQTVPDNYTNHVSNTQRYKMLGNGWTIETIAHILKNMEIK